jgi:predicted esterase
MGHRALGWVGSFAAVLVLTSGAGATCQPPKKGPDKSEKTASPVPDQTIKGDTHKRYFLIKPSTPAPAAGYKLLIVLPGGDGSADFNGFVTNIQKQAAAGYIVAQAVAPQWSKSEDRIVWPTAKTTDAKAQFTTEEFIEAIIADVKSKAKIDDRYVFTLGWSSGGPPSYAEALKKDSPVTGAFVAMSVFKPDQLPPLENGKGKPFYILQSPEDKVVPPRFANAARDQLAAKGAKTTLANYPGGHGWHGDVFGEIRTGLSWLETNAKK